jgi:hypothetical protein
MKKILSILQIVILVLGIIAISYAIGSSIKEVSAIGTGGSKDGDCGTTHKDCTETNSQCCAPADSTTSNYCSQKDTLCNGNPNTATSTTSGGSTAAAVVAASTLIPKSTPPLPGITSTPVKASIPPAIIDDDPQGFIEGLNEPAVNPPVTARFETISQSIKTIGKNALVALAVYTGIQMLGPLLTHDKQAIDAASVAVSAGYFIGSSLDHIVNIFSKSLGKTLTDFMGKKLIFGLSGGFVIGAVVAIGIFLLTYKKTNEIKVQYTCSPWDAPTGGIDCEKCNTGNLPCTEYQCKSLGQACGIINPGTIEEKCIWLNKGDVKPPVIKPWENALLNKDYTYTPDNRISPPDRGVYIKYKGGCIPAFTPFNFGIILDEPAKCKIDTLRKATFNEMNLYFGGSSTLKYNHTQTLTLPSPESLQSENISVQNNGNFELYVLCQDANGNPKDDSKAASFVFKYCVDEGPDTTPPLIVGTNIESGSPIAFNQSKVNIELYVNEPAECRWNHDKDTDFNNMGETMKCSSSVFEMNAQMLYKCSTTLTGIKDREDNKFFFRCKDKPTATKDRNENTQGYEFIIKGTQALVIDEIGPNGTVKDSTETVKVTLTAKTSAGYNEGDATCYYSNSCFETKGSKTAYTQFYYAEGSSSYAHSQDLWLSSGSYTCSIKCVDLGGNTDSKNTTYKVEVDKSSPIVVRAYHEDNYLKIITNEESTCVYGISNCNYLFDPDGIPINTIDNKEHFIDWNSEKIYYIKCKDKYENQPYPNACSIIVRASNDYSKV